jgi:hypothetical protein
VIKFRPSIRLSQEELIATISQLVLNASIETFTNVAPPPQGSRSG